MKALFVALTLVVHFFLFGAEKEADQKSEVRVVPVESMRESESVRTNIVFPEEGAVESTTPIIQLRLEGFPLGIYSDFPRAKEIRDSEQGQRLLLLIDDLPPIAIREAMIDSADTEEIDFDQTITQSIPNDLKEGIHLIRAYPVRSFDESLKQPGAFQASYFYLGKKAGKPFPLETPYLTYNQPRGTFPKNKPILLDFYSTTPLSRDGYKVRLTIDGVDKRILTLWIPYYIYGLKPGSHTIQLELLDGNNRSVAPLFNDLQRSIKVQ